MPVDILHAGMWVGNEMKGRAEGGGGEKQYPKGNS